MNTPHTRQRLSLQYISSQAVLAVLIFSILITGGKTLPATWFAVGGSILCIGALLSRYFLRNGGNNPLRIQSSFLWVILLSLIGWTGLSYITSFTQNYGLDEVLRTAALGFIFLWVLHIDSAENENKIFMNRFLQMFFRLLIISCAIGITVYLFQPVNRFVGTFFDYRFHTDYWPNAFADLLLLGWPVALLMNIDRMMSKKIAALLPLSLIIGCLFLTYSRGALIAFGGQLLLLSIVILIRSWKHHGRIIINIIAMLLLGMCLFLAINVLRSPLHPVQNIGEKITFSADEGHSSVSERSQFWGQAIILMKERPLLGWGPYSFRFVQPRLQESVLATSDHPHNVILKIGMESGIPAMFLFVICIIFCLAIGMRHVLCRDPLPGIRDDALLGYPLCTIAVIGLLAHNLIDYNLQFVGIALPFWILLAIIARRNETTSSKPSTIFTILILTTAILASVTLFVSVREGVFLITSSLGRHAEARNESEKAFFWYNYSGNEWFTRDMLLSMATIKRKQQEYFEAEQLLHTYLERNGEDARAWHLLGNVLLDRGAPQEALDALSEAFTRNGWNDAGISSTILETLLRISLQNVPQSLRAREELAERQPEILNRTEAFAAAITQNIHFIALSENPEAVEKILITLAYLDPADADRYRDLELAVRKHAALERERIRSRAPGMLW